MRLLAVLVWILVWAGIGLHAEGRTVVSVLAPLAYGGECWSSVTLQNLGTSEAAVRVEGHKGSGALVALVGVPSAASPVEMKIAAGGQLTLRLEVPGEESLEGWVKVREVKVSESGSALAVSGETECVVGDKLTTVAQTVAFPTRDPWVTMDGVDAGDRVAMVLNVSNQAATAKACYAGGASVSENGGELRPVCREVWMQIPPLGTRMVPVAREGNSRFSMEAKGEALVLRVLMPQRDGVRTYRVDSTVKFGEARE